MWNVQSGILSALVVFVLSLFILGGLVFAQDTPDVPKVVAFVRDDQLRTASPSDTGADGVSRLVELFRGLGANTITLDLQSAVPTEVDVLVLIGAERPLSVANVARVGEHILRGGSVFIASDPASYNRANTNRAGRDFDQFLQALYGIGVEDGLIVGDWYTTEVLQDIRDVRLATSPESIVQTSVISDLSQYDLPFQVWGARPITVDAFAADMSAFPLTYFDAGYAETDLRDVIRNFRSNLNPRSIGYSIGADPTGRLFVGGYAVNTSLNSRIVMLGDSEAVRNLFGLARIVGSDNLPRHPGNFLLLQSLAAWLLDMPEESWPLLPSGMTFISIDGKSDDWSSRAEATTNISDPALDVSDTRFDIVDGAVFHNDQFVYGILYPLGTPTDGTSIILEFEQEVAISMDTDTVRFLGNNDEIMVPDASFVVNTALEFRIPRRVLTSELTLTRACVRGANDNVEDCLTTPITSTDTNEFDASPVRFTPTGATARTTTTGRVNLRQQPSTQAPIIAVLANNELFAPVNRNANNEWVRVVNGRYEGWLAEDLINLNIEISELPVFGTIAAIDDGNTTADVDASQVGVQELNAIQRIAMDLGNSVIAGLGSSLEDAVASSNLATPAEETSEAESEQATPIPSETQATTPTVAPTPDAIDDATVEDGARSQSVGETAAELGRMVATSTAP